MEKVCTQASESMKYGFSAHAYHTEAMVSHYSNPVDQNDIWEVSRTMSKDYDLTSLMHYGSIQNTNGGPSPDNFPLLRWKKEYSKEDPPPAKATFENSEILLKTLFPSFLDIQALHELYPRLD